MKENTALSYLKGFGNEFHSEAIKNTLPKRGNTPQQTAHGLYTEQLSGSAFTVPRANNLRSWLYRMRPSVCHGEFIAKPHAHLAAHQNNHTDMPPTQMRWAPMPMTEEPCDFIDGLMTFATTNQAAIHLYACNQDMVDTFFYNADGELLIVPQLGHLLFHTEMGSLDIKAGEILVIPRGIKFSVTLQTSSARGYICENHGAPFSLPELGPIGANGLAHQKDFLYPAACFEDKTGDYTLLAKFQGKLWQSNLDHSPLNVVAWSGNYAPYKYDLAQFNAINSVSYDHMDPSIFTVLTSPSQTTGVANIDFVVFPPRWQVTEKTFRPPYFHRNIMSEYMGLIHGQYDAKDSSFKPGGGSLHNCMSAHGPDTASFHKAAQQNLQPEYLADTLAFMFESCHIWQTTAWALNADFRQQDYLDCWQGLAKHFKP